MLNPSPRPRSDLIRELNDQFRSTFIGGTILVTAAFEALPSSTRAAVLQKVRRFDGFDSGNDPYLEHDMGFLDHGGESFFFKIDYYAPDMRNGSDDPSAPERTRRVLTIGLLSDY